MASQWYVAKRIRGGVKRYGPVSGSQLRRLAQDGKVGTDDLLCKKGADRWVPAAEFDGLFPHPPVAGLPAPPASGGTAAVRQDTGSGRTPCRRQSPARGRPVATPAAAAVAGVGGLGVLAVCGFLLLMLSMALDGSSDDTGLPPQGTVMVHPGYPVPPGYSASPLAGGPAGGGGGANFGQTMSLLQSQASGTIDMSRAISGYRP